MYIDKIISYLEERELIYQIIKKNELINKKNIILYCGFDSSYNSLHIGHLIPLICLKKFIENKFKVIVIIGDYTSLVGDIDSKRKKNISKKEIKEWNKSIIKQISLILNIKKNKDYLLIIKNSKWLKSLKLINFLLKIGNLININSILNKEIIKSRLVNINKLSFKEFSYNLIQGYDFLHLNNKYNVNLQIGGSDQWSNIITGIKLNKKINNKNTYGITLPLLTDSNGIKISKSKNCKIWLDPNQTNIYKFYQFWINIPDNILSKYLKYFTNISNKKINYICNSNDYSKYIYGKSIIAKKLTILVHGKKKFNIIIQIVNILFKNKKNILDKINLDFLYKNNFNLIKIYKENYLENIILINNILKSKSEFKRYINQNSIRINKKIILNIKYLILKKKLLYNKYILLSIGKKQFYLIVWIN